MYLRSTLAYSGRFLYYRSISRPAVCIDGNAGGKFRFMTTGAKKNILSKWAFEMAFAEIRDGRTLSMICANGAFPERGDVLRHLSNSEDAEAKMLRARQIGVWMQMDQIYEQLSNVEASKLPMLIRGLEMVQKICVEYLFPILCDRCRSISMIIQPASRLPSIIVDLVKRSWRSISFYKDY